jgi:S-DNA-T family DNA segregation ATPase FtsK/SpoIIIE
MLELPRFVFFEIPRLVFETLFILAIVAVRYPIRATILTVVVVSGVLFGADAVFTVLVYVPSALVLWGVVSWLLMRASRGERMASWAAWRVLVGRPVHSGWRRWHLYSRRWKRVLQAQALTNVIAHAYDDVPRLSSVRVTDSGDRLRVKVLPGQTPADYVGLDGQTARNLAKAFKARECRVRDIAQTDYITLDLLRGDDPLAAVVSFPGVPSSTAEVDLRAIPIGVDENGRVVTVPLLGAHVLLAGLTGAGKGSVFWSIILHLVPFIREGSVKLIGIDPKSGVELFPGRNLFTGGYCDTNDPEDIAALLGQAVSIMDKSSARLKAAGLRKLEPTPEHPLYVVVMDELGRLSDYKDIQALIKTIVNVGRAPGVSALGALQNPTKETVKSRDEWPVKVALKLESADYVRMMLGRASYLAGARCDEIPLELPGVGYAKVEALADDLNDKSRVAWWKRVAPWNRGASDLTTQRPPTRFRAYWVTNEMIEQANRSFDPDAGDDEPRPASTAAPVATAGADPIPA